MTKKISVILLSLTMVVFLAGCGGNSTEKADGANTPAVEKTHSEHPTADKQSSEHPKAEHPKSEHPKADDSKSDHPK